MTRELASAAAGLAAITGDEEACRARAAQAPAPSVPDMIEAEKLTQRYGPVTAVDHFTFAAAPAT